MKIYPKIIIDDVKIDGANNLPVASRDQLIASLERHEFDGNRDWLAQREADVREFWADQGYFRVNVTAEVKVLDSSSTRQHVSIAFQVEEGPKYHLRNVRFRNIDPAVPLAYPPDKLRKLIPIEDGELFSVSGIRDGLIALKNLCGSGGFIDFVSTLNTDIDESSRQLSVVFELDPERQYRIGKIEILGPNQEVEIALKAQLKVGDFLNESAIKDFYHRNQPLLPPDASPNDMQVIRDMKSGAATLVFDFRDCPP